MSAAWIAALSSGGAYAHAAALWAAAMLRACGQGSMALALVWLVTRSSVPGAGRLPSAARCWLWRLAFLKLIVALLWAPVVNLPWVPRPTAERLPWGNGGVGYPRAAWVDWVLGVGSAPSDLTPNTQHLTPNTQRPTPKELTGVLVLFWLLGVAGSTVRFMGQRRQTRRWREAAVPLRNEGLIAECEALCLRLGVRRAPRLLEVEGDGSPWLVGIRAPAILFPAALLNRCSESEARLMLAHELAHLRRRDLPWGWLGSIAQGLFFFHPLVWLAGGEWRLAQEMACDALAMEITRAPAAEYGGVLLKVARSIPAQGCAAGTRLGVLESYHTLKRRLIAMKSFGNPRRMGMGALPLVALGALALIPWRVGAEERHPPTGVGTRGAPAPAPRFVIITFKGPGVGANLMGLALRPDVQAHLQLSPDQRNALVDIQKRLEDSEQAGEEVERRAHEEGVSKEELEARQQAQAERAQATMDGATQQLMTLLSPAQLQRLRELALQRQGPFALADPQTAEAVRLSPAHRAAIEAIVKALDESRGVAVKLKFEGTEAGGTAIRLDALDPVRDEQSAVPTKRLSAPEEDAPIKEAAARILATLDLGERARWSALQGAPFAFAPDQPVGILGR